MSLLLVAKNSYPAIEASDVRCEQVRDYASRIADLKEKKETISQTNGGPYLKIVKNIKSFVHSLELVKQQHVELLVN